VRGAIRILANGDVADGALCLNRTAHASRIIESITSAGGKDAS